MSSSGERENLVFLDACCLINLFATGCSEDILVALPHRFAVARYVIEEEVLEIDFDADGGALSSDVGRAPLRPLLAEFVDKGLLEQLDIRSAEEQTELVRFAAELDDGEAHTCALAIVRGARVATDDKKAIRVFRSICEDRGREGDPILRTSECLFSWARARKLSEEEFGAVVRAIARRASFFPPKDDPHFEHWMALLGNRDRGR